MNHLLQRLAGSRWLFATCALAYLSLAGPWLISAASTAAVVAGIALLAGLLAWGVRLFDSIRRRTES